MTDQQYPKRLIEVDLPIKRISLHSRREKYVGNITSLHQWWARRPLVACRAVILAALWPDPADPLCPIAFIKAARQAMQAWTPYERQRLMSEESRPRFDAARREPARFENPLELRGALLDFIADFANWDNSTVIDYLETSRALTQSAHEALGGAAGTRPLVLDPFAGGGSIPLEALRVGADAFASDLNPIPVLLNKVALEYIPKYGQRLVEQVKKWGAWIKQEAEKELGEFYPNDPDGATPIAYLWARTIRCEGPGCGAEVPLIRSMWLSKKTGRMTALKLVSRPDKRFVDIEIIANAKHAEVSHGTVRRGSATCPYCGYTTPVASVRAQLKTRRGGADDARLLAVVTTRPGQTGRFYRLPIEQDFTAIAAAQDELEKRKLSHSGPLSLVPEEPTPQGGGSGAGRAFSQRNYGMDRFCDLFTARQLLALITLARMSVEAGNQVRTREEAEFAEAVQVGLALAVSRASDHSNSGCSWNPTGEKLQHLFTRQALPIVWDFCETNILAASVGSWISMLAAIETGLQSATSNSGVGHAQICSAASHCLPNDSAHAFVTDPPYYDAVPYADLSDFFFVWLKRALPGFTGEILSPKNEECIVDEVKGKDKAWFESTMGKAMAEGRRVLAPDGVGVVVFAHKSTGGWETQLQAMVDAGWVVTGSWPIDTEMGTRLRAMDSAALASSVHIVVRPRENPDGSLRTHEIGDWRDVLAELPVRIHEWMPRLAKEGVVGADAIFACLGPALEVFSRYTRVEKASGETVTLKEYLEHIWAAVAKEALAQVFKDADTTSFEPDARLTAMWLWTLNAGATSSGGSEDDTEEQDDDEESKGKSAKAKGGFVLEYDAARKIAQGLGASLENLSSIIEVSGNSARLLPVSERTRHLFGKDQADVPVAGRKKKAAQMDLFGELAQASDSETAWGEKTIQKMGETTLDRIHQSMILFATGRGEALKRFLVEDGAGNDQRFWRLAQALSALYPASSTEKRWVDGVLARKKGLGL